MVMCGENKKKKKENSYEVIGRRSMETGIR